MLVAALLACWLPTAQAHAQTPTAGQLERVALDARRHSLRSGRVVLSYVPEKLDEGRQLVRDSERKYHVLFDADRIRFGWHGRHPKGTNWGDIDWTILDGEKCIWDAERDIAVRITNRAIDTKAGELSQVFHPRALGMSVNAPYRLWQDDLGGLLNRSDRRAIGVTQEMVGDVPAWRTDYEVVEIPSGSPVTSFAASVWIAPSQGDSIVRATEQYVTKSGTEILEVRSKLKQYSPSDMWYPSETVTSAAYNGTLRVRDTVRVKEAEFNMPIDSEEFTLAGLDLKIGRAIVDESEGPARGLRWDGEKAVGISAEEVRLQEEVAARVYPEPPVPWSGIFKFGGATLLAVGAVGFGWYGLRRRAG